MNNGQFFNLFKYGGLQNEKGLKMKFKKIFSIFSLTLLLSPLCNARNTVYTVHFREDRQMVECKIWDMVTGRKIRTLKIPSDKPLEVAVRDDCKVMAIFINPRTIQNCDITQDPYHILKPTEFNFDAIFPKAKTPAWTGRKTGDNEYEFKFGGWGELRSPRTSWKAFLTDDKKIILIHTPSRNFSSVRRNPETTKIIPVICHDKIEPRLLAFNDEDTIIAVQVGEGVNFYDTETGLLAYSSRESSEYEEKEEDKRVSFAQETVQPGVHAKLGDGRRLASWKSLTVSL